MKPYSAFNNICKNIKNTVKGIRSINEFDKINDTVTDNISVVSNVVFWNLRHNLLQNKKMKHDVIHKQVPSHILSSALTSLKSS